jgi:hypothetical protein
MSVLLGDCDCPCGAVLTGRVLVWKPFVGIAPLDCNADPPIIIDRQSGYCSELVYLTASVSSRRTILYQHCEDHDNPCSSGWQKYIGCWEQSNISESVNRYTGCIDGGVPVLTYGTTDPYCSGVDPSDPIAWAWYPGLVDDFYPVDVTERVCSENSFVHSWIEYYNTNGDPPDHGNYTDPCATGEGITFPNYTAAVQYDVTISLSQPYTLDDLKSDLLSMQEAVGYNGGNRTARYGSNGELQITEEITWVISQDAIMDLAGILNNAACPDYESGYEAQVGYALKSKRCINPVDYPSPAQWVSNHSECTTGTESCVSFTPDPTGCYEYKRTT